MLHPLSSVNTKARIGRNTSIGPYSIVSEYAEIGDNCEIGPFVIIGPDTKIGDRCRISAGVIIGREPQDKNYQGERTSCIIGDDNVIREYATITRASGSGNRTCIGNKNYIMTYVHIAHNVQIGDNVVITSGSQLGGYVEVESDVTIGGLVGIHQYCRVGQLAMVGALSYLNKDFPPFFIGRGNPCRVRGVNREGLRRNDMMGEYEFLKHAYRTIYRSNLNLTQALRVLQSRSNISPVVSTLLDFVRTAKKGIVLKA
jgi:UDP-N-acetylglucosamine acyltransferase